MNTFVYNGRVPPELVSRALEAYNTYKSDKDSYISRIRDNERFYRESYSYMSDTLEKGMTCDTPLIFSAVENARADAIDNFPTAAILERTPEGTKAAELLSKIVPAQLDISDFKRAFKENMRVKLKYGTAVYGVFYNDRTGNIDIKSVDILDIYVDMHIRDIQESQFMFINAAVENDILKERYPKYAELFTGDAVVETLTQSYQLKNRTTVLDCYYKKSDGTLHMMKLCRNTIIAATEDMPGYEKGLYDHGMYPVVFDVLYPVEHCPFGFGMIDIGKSTQVEINKLDSAITENIMCGAKPRYLSKRNGGIDECEFSDMSKNVVHYEGETDALKVIDTTALSENYLIHREYKKDELKEVLANRDFQQGSTAGGVTAASAIETLRQTGEKRSRSLINDTYDSYKKVVILMLELMRQFFEEKRVYRTTDDMGQKSFNEFDNSMMYTRKWGKNGAVWKKLAFDIDIVPQKENPMSREATNNTIMAIWNNGMFLPENSENAILALKSMTFDGKEKLIGDLQQRMNREVSEYGGEEKGVNGSGAGGAKNIKKDSGTVSGVGNVISDIS